MAWLHAPLDEKLGGGTRLQKHPKHEPLPLPENDYPELVDFLFRAGPSMAGGMGAVPLSSTELAAWCKGCGVDLSPWEFETILLLSGHYVSQQHEAKSSICPAPWITIPNADKRKAINDKVRQLFS